MPGLPLSHFPRLSHLQLTREALYLNLLPTLTPAASPTPVCLHLSASAAAMHTATPTHLFLTTTAFYYLLSFPSPSLTACYLSFCYSPAFLTLASAAVLPSAVSVQSA